MKTLYIRSPTATPPSPTSSPHEQTDSMKQFYDEDEQMEMVETYYQNASVQYKIYSYSVGIVSGLCSLLFLYFAVIGEDFGESIGMERIRLVHTLSSIGLLTLSIRCFYRYTIWKQSTINYLLMNNSTSNFTYNINNINNNNNNNMDNNELILNNSNLSLKSGEEGYNSFTNNNLNNRSNTSAYFATPSTILTDHPMDDGESSNSLSHHSVISTPSQVIENSNNVQVIGNLKIPQILFICLFISILVAAFELLLWTPSMIEHYHLLTQVGAPLGREHFKLAILVFPFVLPIMIVASEYGHFLLNQNFVDIIDLNNHRYKFKKL
ncbi:predicted protein [Naegleria gruberi]|uniref:Predicted protein n=1 Tax=Naegleria gruberi TaxID=5762 RepID=D2VIB2_NAEGR|nr:uncharacterized protein NAEGRDRAFT_68625 [Naegleria gruberi]EFC43565.1 predicted protein [Naegleria gruberi]|eukprot:XP_002676309.1 predicted protein [Naegleria gruberi strain NEG-M]